MSKIEFKGKEFIYNHHLAVPFRPLVAHAPKNGGGGDLDGNLIIHGDNLHALKAILPYHAGKVDSIYIDPPYNTGNEGWSYNDNVNHPMIIEWLEQTVGIDDGLKHDKWCCMMWPRLKLLHELLSENGSIFISIDDNEHHHLRMIMDEVFGADNFRNVITVRRGVKNLQSQFKDIDRLAVGQEYILFYSKSPETRFSKLHKTRDYTRPGGWNNHWRGTDRKTMRYELLGHIPSSGQWRWGRQRSLQAIANYEQLQRDIGDDNPSQRAIDKWWSSKLPEKKDLVRLSTSGRPEHYVPPSTKQLLSSLWTDMISNESRSVLDSLGVQFDNPKRVDLIKRIIEFVTPPGGSSLILDSFAGSGTTAHAVLQLNRQDGGNRRFVLIEQMDYADNLTANRVQRIMSGYPFTGIQRTELMRERVTWTKLRNSHTLINAVNTLKEKHAHEYDSIKSEIKNGELIVAGETRVEKWAKGLGGSFTYCTLGEPVNIDRILTGDTLPPYGGIGAMLFHMATNNVLDLEGVRETEFYLGEAGSHHVWLMYKPDLDWLKSSEAALTLSRARGFASYDEQKAHLVFSPARYVSQKMLVEQKIQVEFIPLPFSLFRIAGI